MSDNIFKPRDFVYINQEKLDSYFSQLFGGLIRDVQVADSNEKEISKTKEIKSEISGKFGLGEGSEKLLGFIMGYFGKVEGSVKGELNANKINTMRNSESTGTGKTLEHFQYTLLEESLIGTDYLIDLDEVIRAETFSAEEIKEKLEVSHFVKYTASSLELIDYRNAINFASMIGKIVDHSAKFIQGSYTDVLEFYTALEASIGDANYREDLERIKDKDEVYLRKLALAEIASKLSQGTTTVGNGEKFNAILDVITDVLSGEMIPLDILLKTNLTDLAGGQISFESQLKEKYLLEDRTDLSFKYGYFEDARWTIIAQINSLKSPSQYSFNETVNEFSENIQQLFSNPTEIEITGALKGVIKEIDALTKKGGLLPSVGENNISVTPLVIYVEPLKNPFK